MRLCQHASDRVENNYTHDSDIVLMRLVLWFVLGLGMVLGVWLGLGSCYDQGKFSIIVRVRSSMGASAGHHIT